MNDELITETHTEQLQDILRERFEEEYDPTQYDWQYDILGKRMFHYYGGRVFGHTKFDLDKDDNIFAVFYEYS